MGLDQSFTSWPSWLWVPPRLPPHVFSFVLSASSPPWGSLFNLGGGGGTCHKCSGSWCLRYQAPSPMAPVLPRLAWRSSALPPRSWGTLRTRSPHARPWPTIPRLLPARPTVALDTRSSPRTATRQTRVRMGVIRFHINQQSSTRLTHKSPHLSCYGI